MGRKDNDGSILGGVLLGLGALAGAGYAAYKAIKKKQGSSPQLPDKRIIVSPSDYNSLLDFNEDYIGDYHVVLTRALPAMAALINKSGYIDIREDNEYIDPYINTIRSNLSNSDLQTEYVDLFIRQTIDLVYSSILSHSEELSLEDSIVSFISEKYGSDLGKIESVFSSVFQIVKKMNGAAYSETLRLAKKLGLKKEDVSRIAVEAGFREEYISFPSIPIKPSMYEDICDFDEDHLGAAYQDSFFCHFVDCRIVPSIAALCCLSSGEDLRTSSYKNDYIKGIKENAKTDWSYGPLYSIQPFISETIHCVYSKNNSYLDGLRSRIKERLIRADNNDLNLHVCYGCLLLTGPLKKGGWQELFDIFSGKVSEKTISDMANDLEYDTSELRIKNSAMIEEKLKVLGLKRGASIEEISSAFKKLSLRVHPDTIANKELDDEFIQFANKRFIEIKEAYNYLKMNY